MEQPAARTAVIVDEQPLWLAGAERLLEQMAIKVVGTTASAGSALALVGRHKPDLLMTNVSIDDPDLDGLDFLRLAIARHPHVKSIVVAPDNDPNDIRAAFAAGAKAYVLTSASAEDIAAAVRQVFEARIYVVSPFAPAPRTGSPPAAAADPSTTLLTRREREILVHAAEGLSNAAIARVLCVTEQTVKFHLSNVYRKLGASNRTEASRWAQLHGLLSGGTGTPERRLAATR